MLAATASHWIHMADMKKDIEKSTNRSRIKLYA